MFVCGQHCTQFPKYHNKVKESAIKMCSSKIRRKKDPLDLKTEIFTQHGLAHAKPC